MEAPLIELVGVSKSFGPTPALRDLTFRVRAGEVHALVGENGAGKSTLIGILSGVYSDYSGELRIAGNRVRLDGPAAAARHGVATIYQELSLVPSMSVGDNLLLGSDRGPLFGVLNRRARRAAARRILEGAGLDLDPELPLASLPLSVRQLVEIERALARRAQVVIMDEPTSALSDAEAAVLLGRVEELKRRGTGIVYVSHRMDEIERIADQVSVLCDGVCVLSRARRELSRQQLVEAMLGQALGAQAQRARVVAGEPGGPLLEVRGLGLVDARQSGRFHVHDASFELRAGEIVGLAGLRGAGKSELLHALFGSFGRVRGRVRLAGEEHVIRSPERALAAGIVLLANDRKRTVLPEMSARANVSLSSLLRYTRARSWVDRRREAEAALGVAGRVRLAPARLPLPARQLSGGNQQKVALGRCLSVEPRVLLLDEPTRGVDIGAKADIYALVRELAAQGVAVLLVASELEELLLLSGRVLVMDGGTIVEQLEGERLTRERVAAAEMTRIQRAPVPET